MKFIFSIMAYFPDHIGGAWMYANGLAEELVKLGHKVDVIVPRENNKLPDKSTINGVDIHRLPPPEKKTHFFAKWFHDNKQLSHFLSRELFDHDSIFINHQAYMGKGFCSWKGPRTAAVFHGPWDEEFLIAKSFDSQSPIKKLFLKGISGWMKSIERKSLLHSKTVITASEYAANKFKETNKRIQKPIVNISAGTDYERFSPSSDEKIARFKERFQIEKNTFVIGSVRRLDKRMGLDMLIDGFYIASRSINNLHLLIAGKGPQLDELKAKIDSLDLSSRITLAGFVSDEDLPTFYSSCDLTVMPSLDLEGFGLSTIESLGSGTPVLASDSGANLETVSPFDQGLIFRKGDTHELADKIIQIASGEKSLPTIEQCRQYSQNSFSWQKTAEKLINHFESKP